MIDLQRIAPLIVLTVATLAEGQEPPAPRPGLTALQTQQAVRIAGGSLDQVQPKAGPDRKPDPDRDRREYVVSVERLTEKPAPGAENAEAPARAVVTMYRYADDTTVYSVVDLASGKAVEVKTAQHMRTPLSDGEFQAAKILARDQSADIRALYQQYGDRLEVYPQFSQYTPDGDPRVHRVVFLLYRVDKRDLSSPRPVVDLTTRQVKVPRPKPDPGGN